MYFVKPTEYHTPLYVLSGVFNASSAQPLQGPKAGKDFSMIFLAGSGEGFHL